MGLQTNVFRRGATYVWRKRLPPALGSKLMQVSLRTNTPAIARRIAPMLSAEAAETIEAMKIDRLSLEAARAKLQTVILRALDDLQGIRAEADLIVAQPAKVSRATAKPRTIPKREPKSAPNPLPDAPNGYNPAMKAVAERLLDQKRRQKMSAQMVQQMSKMFSLFVEITGVRDIRRLEQAHLAQYADTLAQLPANYRKSPLDRSKPLSEIIASRGDAETLSVSTINRNLDYIGQLLTKDAQGKVFHSFRHYVATQLGRLTDVKDQTRADILGHAGGSITAERYSETTPLPVMLAALAQLPRLPLTGSEGG